MEWWQVKDLMITGAIIVAVLVPVLAYTYRFLSKTSGLGRNRLEGERADASAALQEARLDGMERQLVDIEASLRRLVEASDFDRQLKAGSQQDTDG